MWKCSSNIFYCCDLVASQENHRKQNITQETLLTVGYRILFLHWRQFKIPLLKFILSYILHLMSYNIISISKLIKIPQNLFSKTGPCIVYNILLFSVYRRSQIIYNFFSRTFKVKRYGKIILLIVKKMLFLTIITFNLLFIKC